MTTTAQPPVVDFPTPIARFAARVRGLVGWRRRGAAALAGALSVLAMAPFHVWPALLVTLPVLVWLIDGKRSTAALTSAPRRWLAMLAHPAARAAGAGWWFGFGYFFAGLFWIGEAFLVEAEVFAVLLPFAVTLMPAGLALFWAAAAAIAVRFWPAGPGRVLSLALGLSAAEWLRGHVLTGFPWNVLGYALTWPLPLMQSAALFGIYGLTLIAVILLATPLVVEADRAPEDRALPLWSRLRLPALTFLLPIATAFLWGTLRLAVADPPAQPEVRVRIVQPSVPQREKWQPDNQGRIFREHIDLSLRSPDGVIDGARGVHMIVWPEAAMPFLPLARPDALDAIRSMLPDGAYLLSGALRLGPMTLDNRNRVYNSLLAFPSGGRTVIAYDKTHLVPFGEYLPLQPVLEAIGLQQLSRLRGGFEPGPRPRPLLRLEGLPPLGPLVCYEAIFPRAIVQGAERPAALVNVTNDGWFGNTTGPRQHLHQARVRAVEEGLPLVRAANNGISALIDGRGRMVGRLGLDVKGTLDAVLPPPLSPPLYGRLGDTLFLLLWLAGAAALRRAMKGGEL